VFFRALVAFLVLPGVFAFAIPVSWLLVTGNTQLRQPTGLVLLVAGVAGLLWCVRDFYVRGRGTLAPWSPPERLVVVGLYRYSRNPMYVSVLTILAGWAVAFESPPLFAYAAIVAAGFHARVVRHEEPFLARTHGDAWHEYARSVSRWIW
jgi:protein-S-isoprenylcysteine O-methyltransferase Ste14